MAREFTDEYIRHQFYLLGLGNGQSDELLSTLDDTHDETAALLAAFLYDILRARPLTKTQDLRIKALSAKIDGVRGGAIRGFRDSYEQELESLVAMELRFNVKQYESLPIDQDVKQPDSAEVSSLLIAFGAFEGRTVDDWFTSFIAGDSKRIEQQIRAGANSGLSSQEIITATLGSKNLGYKNGIVNITRNSARTLTKTIWNGVANQARGIFSKTNTRLIAYEVYTAILDGRTTAVCASLDSSRFPVGEGPYPPLHRNCRSVRYPVTEILANEGILGDRQSVRDTRSPRELRKDFRADAKRRVGGSRWSDISEKARRAEIAAEKASWVKKNVGSEPANVSWQTWFDRQPAWFQKDYLGPTKYKAFKGGTKIPEFVAPSGRSYTIEQLRRKGVV